MPPSGLEPETLRLLAARSDQLSHEGRWSTTPLAVRRVCARVDGTSHSTTHVESAADGLRSDPEISIRLHLSAPAHDPLIARRRARLLAHGLSASRRRITTVGHPGVAPESEAADCFSSVGPAGCVRGARGRAASL